MRSEAASIVADAYRRASKLVELYEEDDDLTFTVDEALLFAAAAIDAACRESTASDEAKARARALWATQHETVSQPRTSMVRGPCSSPP